MDNARKIAEERFARGEISEEEFRKIVSVIGDRKEAVEVPSAPPFQSAVSSNARKPGFLGTWQADTLTAVTMLVVISLIGNNFAWETMPPLGKTILVGAVLLFGVYTFCAIYRFFKGQSV